jgi:ATP-dependent DNA ligase
MKRVRVLTRNAVNWTDRFPLIIAAAEAAKNGLSRRGQD